ncbi:MAG: chemotaxis protein CheA [Deltaproteobacteria bacterium]|nr:chemotaxis protein CheA [Deltaproteobacteria bacterium]
MTEKEFRAEAAELVEALANGVSALDTGLRGGRVAPALINDVFRAAHSLKGIGGLIGLPALGHLAHAMEDALDAMRLGKVTPTTGVLSVLDEAVELFQKLVEANPQEAARLEDRVNEVSRRVGAIKTGVEPAAAVVARTPKDLDLAPEFFSVLTEYEEHRLTDNVAQGVPIYLVHAPLALDAFDVGLGKLTEALKSRGEIITTLPSSEKAPGVIAFDLLFAGQVAVAELGDAVRALDPAFTASIVGTRPRNSVQAPEPAPARPAAVEEETLVPAHSAATPRTETVRVDIEKLDRLMNVVGEIALVRTGLGRIADLLRVDGGHTQPVIELQKLARSLERKIDELQGGIMEVRMVPLTQTFERLQRIVKKTARELAKEVEFVVHGEETELDKLLMEQLVDPLVPLVRNAVDHGVESADARQRAGKPAAGRVTISAQPRGNHVLISVEDDGAGLDEVAIRKAALEKLLVTEERVGTLTGRELWNLIFLPGFSTRREATDVSGRGVGMDVVKTNIARLSGMIEIDSVAGRGTRFSLTVPITLAIIQSLIVRVRGRTLAMPLGGVSEILAYDGQLLRTVEAREVFQTRKGTVPLLRLGDVFGYPGTDVANGYVILVGVGLNRVGIVVDELVGRQDIVIKPMGRLLKGLRGIAGATDLGERSTVLVLDVGGLVEEALGVNAAA